MGRLAKPSRTVVQVSILTALVVWIVTAFWFGALGVVIGFVGWRTWEWLGDGYVKQSELEAARDRALRKCLPPPGRRYPGWHAWAKDVVAEVHSSDPLPGKSNSALLSYLVDEHDADVMDQLFNDRVWPRDPNCFCKRVEGRPWELNHQMSCPLMKGYVIHEELPTAMNQPAEYKADAYCVNCGYEGPVTAPVGITVANQPCPLCACLMLRPVALREWDERHAH
jgi:hypothetical protein